MAGLFVNQEELSELLGTGRIPAPVSLCDIPNGDISNYVPYDPPYNPDSALYTVCPVEHSGVYSFELRPRPLLEFIAALKGRLAAEVDRKLSLGINVKKRSYSCTDADVHIAGLVVTSAKRYVYYKNQGVVHRLHRMAMRSISSKLQRFHSAILGIRAEAMDIIDFAWSQEQAYSVYCSCLKKLNNIA